MAKNSQVSDGAADHCYMRASGGCFGSQNTLDTRWNSGIEASAKDPNLNWLTGFTRR